MNNTYTPGKGNSATSPGNDTPKDRFQDHGVRSANDFPNTSCVPQRELWTQDLFAFLSKHLARLRFTYRVVVLCSVKVLVRSTWLFLASPFERALVVGLAPARTHPIPARRPPRPFRRRRAQKQQCDPYQCPYHHLDCSALVIAACEKSSDFRRSFTMPFSGWGMQL